MSTDEQSRSNVVVLDDVTRMRKRAWIPPVPVDRLADVGPVFARFVEDGKGGFALAAVSLVMRRIPGWRTMPGWVMACFDLDCRLTALLNFVDEQGYSEPAVRAVLQGEDPALLRAAARAPLRNVEPTSHCRFELAPFLALLQEERKAPAAPADVEAAPTGDAA